MSQSFLEIHKEGMETLGFWTEEYRQAIITILESGYKEEVTKYYGITDIVINGDKVLIKWRKRIIPINH